MDDFFHFKPTKTIDAFTPKGRRVTRGEFSQDSRLEFIAFRGLAIAVWGPNFPLCSTLEKALKQADKNIDKAGLAPAHEN
jgi:hypothetical protein